MDSNAEKIVRILGLKEFEILLWVREIMDRLGESEGERQKIRANLLTYSGQDTGGTIEIIYRLGQLVEGSQRLYVDYKPILSQVSISPSASIRDRKLAESKGVSFQERCRAPLLSRRPLPLLREGGRG